MMSGAADHLGLGSLLEDIGGAMPGIDEAMSFAEVLKLVVSLEFSVVVFDTAPTGHTLRFLSFPDMLEKALGKFDSMKNQFGGMFKQFGGMMGMDGEGMMGDRLQEVRDLTSKVGRQFKGNLRYF
jgi:arsenite-transporting ATPase